MIPDPRALSKFDMASPIPLGPTMNSVLPALALPGSAAVGASAAPDTVPSAPASQAAPPIDLRSALVGQQGTLSRATFDDSAASASRSADAFSKGAYGVALGNAVRSAVGLPLTVPAAGLDVVSSMARGVGSAVSGVAKGLAGSSAADTPVVAPTPQATVKPTPEATVAALATKARGQSPADNLIGALAGLPAFQADRIIGTLLQANEQQPKNNLATAYAFQHANELGKAMALTDPKARADAINAEASAQLGRIRELAYGPANAIYPAPGGTAKL